MLKEILVCLEGSPSGAEAVAVAIRLASELDAALVGLAIVDEPDIRAGEPTPIGGASFKAQRDEALLRDAHAHAQQWLDDFTRRCRDAGVLAVGSEVSGRPAESILQAARHRDLTILGRHANFRCETDEDDRRTREAVLRGASRPVMVVPERSDEAGRAVLVAYDGTPASIRAIHSLAASGIARGRDVHVVSIGDDGAAAWETAERGRALLAGDGIAATAHHVVSLQSTAEAILAEGRKVGAGLIVQGAYARSRFARLLWGSVTKEMLEKSDVPIYLHY